MLLAKLQSEEIKKKIIKNKYKLKGDIIFIKNYLGKKEKYKEK